MRLIDADRILKRIESWNTFDAMDKALYNFTLNRIVEQSTVDAIPVEWLEARYPIHDTYGTEAYFRKAHAVHEVIKEWSARKEDETS